MFGIRAQSKRKFGDEVFSQQAMPAAPVQQMAQEGAAAPAPEQRKPGFFKPGGGSQYVFAALADTLARQMDEQPQAVSGIMQQQQRAQELAEKQRQASVKRDMDWQDFTREHNYRVNNPTPQRDDTFTRTLEAAGIDPVSDEGKALYRQRADTLANPTQWITGADGVPRPMARNMPAIGAVMPDPRKAGGAGSNVSGGFREAFAGL